MQAAHADSAWRSEDAGSAASMADLLATPFAFVARLAVTEASLHRLHGSPERQQPGSAGQQPGGAPAAGQVPAGTSARQKGAGICRCIGEAGAGAGKPCQIGPMVGLGPGSNTAGLPAQQMPRQGSWEDCFGLFKAIMSQEVETGGISHAQRCGQLAQGLRALLSGLPAGNCLAAATACMIAHFLPCLAGRHISQQASLTLSCCGQSLPFTGFF